MKADELWQDTLAALKLPARERFAALKQIGFKVVSSFKDTKDPTLEELQCYAQILRVVVKMPSPPPQLSLCLPKIIAKTLTLMGCENPSILLKKSSTIFLTSAMIAVGDMSYATTEDFSLKLINEGKMYAFGTGSDGEYPIQVRVVNAPEPVLATKEYKRVLGVSPLVILNFPTGQLAVDNGVITSSPPITVSIEPGIYKCQVFIFDPSKANDDSDFYYYIVLSKTDKEAVNDEKEIVTLEPV